ncbi:DUF6941 family protein [Stutzerimonas nitrititolerans]|uniref:DUF6941 family protein n=1 Tax=Stutzerimonas nitrititolerans TaxID=2482751 RepID=UPI0028ACA3E4|nr:hypothetical protein [Stutzerimonas nitrititolerans]
MNKTTPKPVSVILCEDIRREEGGKVSLIGVLTNGIKVLARGDGTWGLAQLCVYAQFKSNSIAEYNAYVEVLDPDGNQVIKTDTRPVPNVESAVAMTMKINNFELPKSGEYKFNIYFDGKKTSQGFMFNLIQQAADPENG